MSRPFDISPFSMANRYIVRWGRQPNVKIPKLNLHERKTEALRNLSVLKLASKIQLALQFNPGNIRRGKKNVDFLKDKGVLVEHALISRERNQTIPFYSLSDQMLESFGEKPMNKMYTIDILKQLLLSQFQTRFLAIDEKTKVKIFPKPFDACFEIMGSEFRVAVIREKVQLEKVHNHLKFMDENMRTLIVIEDLEYARMLLHLENKADMFRVITDHNLLKSDLCDSFYRVENNDWYPEYIEPFDIKKKDAAI
jgi:hypothetical protein